MPVTKSCSSVSIKKNFYHSVNVIKHFYLLVMAQKNKLARFREWDYSQTLNEAE
jgi:hypothetical protein